MKRRSSSTCQFYTTGYACEREATHNVFQGTTRVGQACPEHAEQVQRNTPGITVEPRQPR
jgi:hypothetical protein